jgi:hypothetical protein
MSEPGEASLARDGRPRRDLTAYKKLISDGIADADRRRGAVDHVTARRMSLVLLSESEDPEFMRGLIAFAQYGAITQPLKKGLRECVRTPGHPQQPQASRLLQYAQARGKNLGPIRDFAVLCDQVDRADVMLADFHDWAREGRCPPEPTGWDPDAQPVTAVARRDPDSRTVSLILDDTTANMAIHAISLSAADREAHMREVAQYADEYPENSYGQVNRRDIAAREMRIANRLRAVEGAYRKLDREEPLEPTELSASLNKAVDRELELG